MLDLAHLEARLPSITDLDHRAKGASRSAELEEQLNDPDQAIPLDSEGWQIASRNLDASLYDDRQAYGPGTVADDGDESWNVASSRRSRRRKRLESSNRATSISRQGTDQGTATSTSRSGTATASTSLSRDASTSGFARIDTDGNVDRNSDDEQGKRGEGEEGRVERKDERKAHKKTRKRSKREEEPDDLGASIVHVRRTSASDRQYTGGTMNGAGRSHKDEEQVALDINRSFIGLGNSESELRHVCIAD